MEKCKVSFLTTLSCKNLGSNSCLFLLNENANSGDASHLYEALKKQPPKFLEMLVNDEAGGSYRKCFIHDRIMNTAKRILAEIQKS